MPKSPKIRVLTPADTRPFRLHPEALSRLRLAVRTGITGKNAPKCGKLCSVHPDNDYPGIFPLVADRACKTWLSQNTFFHMDLSRLTR